MEELFKTSIANNNSEQHYIVVFDHEEYIFKPAGGNATKSFSFRREHDEWHGSENISEDLRQQAIEALERYLLKQH